MNRFRKSRWLRVCVFPPFSEAKACEVISTMFLMSLGITTRPSKLCQELLYNNPSTVSKLNASKLSGANN